MKYVAIFAFIAISIFGCKKDSPNPINTNTTETETSHKLDSIMNIYGEQIDHPGKIMSIYKIIKDTLNNTFLSGRTKTGFWIGVFDPNNKKLTEKYFQIPDSINVTNKDSVFIFRNFPSNNQNAFVIEGFIVKKKNMGENGTRGNKSKRLLAYYNYSQNKLYNTYQFDHGDLKKITPWYHGSFVIENSINLNPDAIKETYYLDSALQPKYYGESGTFFIPGGTSDLVLSYTQYLTFKWQMQSGIVANRLSIYFDRWYLPEKRPKVIWSINKPISKNVAWYYAFHKITDSKLSYTLKNEKLTINADIKGIIRDCVQCEATSKFDTTYSLVVNIETGKTIE